MKGTADYVDAMFDSLVRSRFIELFGHIKTNEKNWSIVTLESIAKINDGEHSSPPKTESGHKYLMARNIQPGHVLDLSVLAYVDETVHKKVYSRCNPETDDLLLTNTGTIGNTLLMPEMEEISLDRGITLIKYDRSKVNGIFLQTCLDSAEIQSEIQNGIHKSAIAHFFLTETKKLCVPLPPIELQKEFAEFVKQVDKSRVIYNQAIEKYDQLIKSRFIEQIKSANYPKITIGDACINTRVGPFGSALHKTEMVSEGPIFVLGTDNAVDNTFNVHEKRYITKEKYAELERYTVSPGDIIITMMGTIGRTAVIPNDFMKAIISSHLSCLTVDSSVVLPEYMQKCMVLDHDVSSHLDSNKKGSIMNGLNLKIIKSIPFTCPPLDVQREFMSFVEQVDKSRNIMLSSIVNTISGMNR